MILSGWRRRVGELFRHRRIIMAVGEGLLLLILDISDIFFLLFCIACDGCIGWRFLIPVLNSMSDGIISLHVCTSLCLRSSVLTRSLTNSCAAVANRDIANMHNAIVASRKTERGSNDGHCERFLVCREAPCQR